MSMNPSLPHRRIRACIGLVVAIAMLPTVALGVEEKSHTPVCGVLGADTVWTADNIYEVSDCNIEVPAGITLTIEPGTVVKFGGIAPGYGSAAGSVALIVDGSLVADGSAGAPVVFTSLADDSHGGDTNENGASTGAPGDWRGLALRAGSTTRLGHFVVAYAGSTVFNSTLGYGRAQIDAVEIASLELADGRVSDGASKGLYLRGTGIAPSVTNVAFERNVNTTTSAGNIGAAIYQYSINMQPDYVGVSFSGNDLDSVTIDQWNSTLTQDVRLSAVPYVNSCSYTSCSLLVPDGRVLTIDPGAALSFKGSTGITVQAGGSLLAEGAADAPIRFAARDAAPNWYGLWAQAGSRLRLAHCDVSQAFNSNSGKGGLEIGTADAVVRDSLFHDNAQDGLVIHAPDAQPLSGIDLQNLRFADNGNDGLVVSAAYRAGLVELTLDGGVAERNGRHGIYLTHGGDGPNLRPTLRNLQVRDNAGSGIHFNTYETSPVLDTLSISGNAINAVHWQCNGSISARAITASGNGYDGILLPGCDIGGGRQWDLQQAGVVVDVTGNITLGAGAFLSLGPGTALRFASERALFVRDGSLFALGTVDAPIRLAGAAGTAGSWRGIDVFGDAASVFMRHCDVRDARTGLHVSYSADQVMLQNCDMHDNLEGTEIQLEGAAIRANSIRDNVDFGVVSGYGAVVDARGNYWGDPSGPQHPTSNPLGLGNPVGDNVLFDPWLGEPPAPVGSQGEVIVATGSPDFVSPGQTSDYAIQLLNLKAETLLDALVVLQLPRAAEYVSSTAGGHYWPERNQVVWNLGDIAAGDSLALSARVQFAWGLPRNYRDGTMTLFSASNHGSDIAAAERAAYLDWTHDPVQQRSLLSGDGSAFRAANPALQALYDAAVADGYLFIAAADVQRAGGSARVAVMRHPDDRAVRLLSHAPVGNRTMLFEFAGNQMRAEGSDGGMSLALDTGLQTFSGDWATAAAKADCTEGACMRNCYAQFLGLQYLGNKAGRILAWTAFSFLGGSGIPGAVWEVGSTAIDLVQCYTDCDANPQAHCCSAGQVKWTSGAVSQALSMCMKQECTALGTWEPLAKGRTCVTGTRCVPSIDGTGCVECEERLIKAADAMELRAALAATPAGELCKATTGGKPRCKDLQLLVAKDPNDIRGADGDVTPGKLLSYTIRYENEGTGIAYGVYIVNDLPEALDADSLVISDGGFYLAAERQIVWSVGELGPQGTPEAEGSRTYSVRVASGLPSGIVIANQAVVFFPSVPEETPTNTWVNLVAPLAAIPQQLETGYETALPITLAGREVGSLPLDYRIVTAPSRGSLSGTPPNLVYTPSGGAVGVDDFVFIVDNGLMESRPAQVRIEVTSAGDGDAPTVQSVFPADGAVRVAFSTQPQAGALGDTYAPGIVLGLSEPIDEATIGAQSLTLASAAGDVPALLSYDPVLNQLTLLPTTPLQRGTTYTFTLAAGIGDLAGNPLGTASWSFTTDSDLVFHDGFEAGVPGVR